MKPCWKCDDETVEALVYQESPLKGVDCIKVWWCHKCGALQIDSSTDDNKVGQYYQVGQKSVAKTITHK